MSVATPRPTVVIEIADVVAMRLGRPMYAALAAPARPLAWRWQRVRCRLGVACGAHY